MILEENSIENVDDTVQEIPNILENEEEGRQCEVALAAYFKAENRGFTPGKELDDWLEAEHDIMGSP